MNTSRLWQILATVVVVGGAAWLMLASDEPMPNVTFNMVDGTTLASADLRGQSVLVNFWSVSCAVCLRDMPRLTALHDSLADRRFSVIGVAMPSDPPPAVMAMVASKQPGYPIALDVHGELARAFGDVRVTPTSFLIDPAGNIRHTERGPLDEIRIRATLATF